MKAKLLDSIGSSMVGTIVDILISPTKSGAVIFDQNGSHWWVANNQFELLADENNSVDSGKKASLRDFLGYELAEIKFK